MSSSLNCLPFLRIGELGQLGLIFCMFFLYYSQARLSYIQLKKTKQQNLSTSNSQSSAVKQALPTSSFDFVNLIMQQVIRALHGKRQRELQRQKIDSLTPQNIFNNYRYHQQHISPHQVLKHQYQHLQNHPYNDLERISQRKIYPLSHVFAYEPLRANQMEEQRKRSKSISMESQFLRSYDPKTAEAQRQQRLLKVKMTVKQNQEVLQPKRQKSKWSNIFDSRVSHYTNQTESVLQVQPIPKTSHWSKFRSTALAIYFCMLVKSRLKKFILLRRDKCYKYGKLYVQQACFSMQTYYYDLLEQQISQYILLLEKAHRSPKYDNSGDILRVLTFMTTKLNNAPIPKTLLTCLQLITVNYTFFNFAFLFESALSRLEISDEWGCIVEVGMQQSLMLAACLMGIVMLCFNLLYRPWLAEGIFRKMEKRQFSIQQKYERVKETIMNIGSIVYFSVIDNFIFSLETLDRDERQFSSLLKQHKIQLVKNMPIIPKKTKQEHSQGQAAVDSDEQEAKSLPTVHSFRPNAMFRDKTGIVTGQNRQFYEQMKKQQPESIIIINDNLSQWITKATLASLTESDKARQVRAMKFVGLKNKHTKSRGK